MKQLLLFLGFFVLLIGCNSQDGVRQLGSVAADSSSTTLMDSLENTLEFDDNVPDSLRKEIMKKISKKYLMGQFDPTQDARFVQIPALYANKTMYMRKEALAAFEQMHQAAKEAGIDLKILSATRPFDAQKSIWEAKWMGKRKVDGQF